MGWRVQSTIQRIPERRQPKYHPFLGVSTDRSTRTRWKRHDRWIDTVSKIDFTHSSRKAWKTVKRLTGTASAKKVCPISPAQTTLADKLFGMVLSNQKTESLRDKYLQNWRHYDCAILITLTWTSSLPLKKLRLVSISLNLGNLLTQTASITNSWSTLLKML